ncbi:hypothetical protein O0L34_g15864 [Tuta absoluta]|nr:hypothetical protein O0L34_g15864 [Tuta absoluta]
MSHRFRDDDDIDEDRRDEQEFNEEKRQRDRNQAQAGNRQRHDNKPKYAEKEPRFLPKDLNNDMDKPDKDKKTRFQVRHGKKISANEESMNDGKGARDYDEHRPKLTEKKPANNKQDNDIATEKKRFQIHKPPHNEPIAEDKNSEIEEADKRNNNDDNDNQNQNQKHGGKINREKKKTIAENQHGDGEHYGAADAEDEKKRGRYSFEDASKDVERPLPKKKNRQKESKQRPKTSHKKQPSHNREEKQTRGLPKVLKLDKKNREFYDERMWPDGVVRYVIKAPEGVDVDDVRARLNEVNRILKKKTCARLEEITEEETERYEDFLVLDNSPDYVTGRVGGKQVNSRWPRDVFHSLSRKRQDENISVATVGVKETERYTCSPVTRRMAKNRVAIL